ncbi:MAG: protein translocase subunit SecDF [Dysgonamonadaceae bacterium]|nr:protein translocase subunit SecDF [Dysgonamonadaceae bacterium]MDD3356048.1 protein translocase subunit SecDF [Dysgonamonadaceae bacterium]MDD3727769.1 protein translocase subunit SecDF [Dysgonamonadaceae bacterium]MDD4246458.1 protein translocase subunit SecDF [Dysgonamonadaceae bacterium]MDD4605325.1 protein translocase subunit SecDF [Dysgonamonadaceae bacterium]
MLNKGFIKTFAILLGLISLYYLSFSVVSNHYERKAEAYSGGDLNLKTQYLDSMSTEKVYLGYTLKQIREKEIGLGLDLKGGMNVILEIDARGVLSSLANTDDPQFNQALRETVAENRRGSSQDFISLFQQKYEAIDPNAKLANIFSITMSDRINPGDTNDKVISELRHELVSAADNSFNVLRTRIDRFGVVAPNIQKLERAERILIELPGIKEPERVRRLLQGSANLEFWKTYNVNELLNGFNDINSRSAAFVASQQSATPAPEDEVTDSISADSLLVTEKEPETSVDGLDRKKITIDKSFTQYFAEPYFAMGGASGAIVGTVSKNDTAKVNFLLDKFSDSFPADVRFKWGFKAVDTRETYYQLFALRGDGSKRGPALDGDVVVSARADQGQRGSAWEVSMQMNSAGSSRWATITGTEKGRAIAIVLDGYVYSAPNVNDKIEGGRSQITGNFTPEEAKDLENTLKSGKMKAGVRIVQEDIVGPSLGQEAINAGLVSFILALVVLFAFTFMLYGMIPGAIVNAALLLNFFFILGALAAFQAVLTLPGIAGMILSLGMAVDANVLINERIKEELASGKTLRKAVEDGYKNAFSAIFDSNLTTVITAIVLVYFGTGPIKGFAITLIIGISSSFLTAVFLTRLVYEAQFAKGRWQNLTFTTNASKNFLTNPKFKILEKRKKAFMIAGGFVLIGIISLATLQLNRGIDFTGGRNYVVRFDEPVKTTDVQDALAPVFGDNVRVITIGSSNQVRISTNYMIDSDDPDIEDEIKGLLGENLSSYIAPGNTIDDYIQSSQTVGPSVAKDIVQGAFWALLIALIFMGIYIFVRFRNWTFSVGTLTALSIDAFSVIALYSLLYKIMPFSMEIDQTFVAAILTVIGYSVNDKVVVFDRVREYRNLYPKRNLFDLINDSLNATLARTINTSVSTILVILMIFFFGGDAVRSFVFAMLIGIVVGTATSLFIAAPIAYNIMTRKDSTESEVVITKKRR